MRRHTVGEVRELLARRRAIDAGALSEAADIVEDVRRRGPIAVRAHAERLGDIVGDEPIVLPIERLNSAFDRVDQDVAAALARAADRIRDFAEAQRRVLADVTVAVPGGSAGHRWVPVGVVGAYAPGGRYPLPSSVLMTVIPARVAGVSTVVAASPRPADVTLAAAGIAGVDSMLAVGGAQAVAALAFGVFDLPCAMVVGPGNRWVTAAKRYLYGEVGIDGFAGPSEVLAIADRHADPDLVASDLIAQAEHDVDAVPMFIATAETVADAIDTSIQSQLEDLKTADTVRTSLRNGFGLVVQGLREAVEVSNEIAPEHLALHVREPDALLDGLTSYGSVFIGEGSAEAFADYGAGPNHVLPTAGGARFQSGLSVMTYLRAPTWLRLDDPSELVDDTSLLATVEGLDGHAAAARLRRS